MAGSVLARWTIDGTIVDWTVGISRTAPAAVAISFSFGPRPSSTGGSPPKPTSPLKQPSQAASQAPSPAPQTAQMTPSGPSSAQAGPLQPAGPERRGYLLNDQSGRKEYFVLRAGILRSYKSDGKNCAPAELLNQIHLAHSG